MTKRPKYLAVAGIIFGLGLALSYVAFVLDAEAAVRTLAKGGLLVLVLGAAFIGVALWTLGPTRTWTLSINLAVAGTTMAVGLVVAEIATRYIFYDISTTYLGVDYFSHRWRARDRPQHNRYGFREREFAAKRADTYRIAVIGDSMTYGPGIPLEARMTNLLEEKLDATGRRYEVLNFGRPGAETIDHVKILEDIVLGLSPDFVLLQWFTNDVEGDDKSGRPRLRIPNLMPSVVLHSILLRRSALYNVAYITWVRLLQRPGSYEAYMIARFGDPQSPASQSATRALSRFIELNQQHGIPMAIMLIPRTRSYLPDGYPLEFLHERVLGTCADHGIPCLDLRGTFAKVEDLRRLEVSEFDAHLNPYANELVATAVLERFAALWSAADVKRPGP